MLIEKEKLKVELIGMDYMDAIRFCEKNNAIWRILFKDGNAFVVTRDHDPNRAGLIIKNSKIVDVRFG